MLNKYTILSAMYRYGEYNSTWNRKNIEMLFLENSPSRNFIERAFIKRDVLKKYNITDKDSCLKVIEGFFSHAAIENPCMLILYQLWNRYDEKLNLDEIENALSQEFDFEEIARVYYDGIVEVSPYKIEIDHYVETIKEHLKALYNRGKLQLFMEFFKTFNWLIRVAGNSLLIGYNISRTVDIITKSTSAGFISEETCYRYLDRIGGVVQTKFFSWEQYLASCLLGKLYTQYSTGVTDLAAIKKSSYIKSIFLLTNAPNDMLSVASIWPVDNMKAFASVVDHFFKFDMHYDESHLEEASLSDEEARAIELFRKVIFNPAMDGGIGCYFSATDEKGNFYHPLMAVGKRFLFWDVIAKRNQRYAIETSEEELPFLMTNQATFTNKAVYIFERKMLIKRDLIPVKWEDVQFSFKVGHSCEFINVYINGHRVGYLPLYLSRLGVKKENDFIRVNGVKLNELFDTSAEKERLMELFGGIAKRF